MTLNTLLKQHLLTFKNDLLIKIQQQSFYEYTNGDLSKAKIIEAYLNKHRENMELKLFKNYIWTSMPAELLDGEKNKTTRKRFFCENGTIHRQELFALAILLKLNKHQAIDLINGHFKEMYVNYADPFDLAFDYCIQKEKDITTYLWYLKEIERLFEVPDLSIHPLKEIKGVTKTHEIASEYMMFLNQDEYDFITFIAMHKNDFHLKSHYIYKLLYHLIQEDNLYYHQGYLSKSKKGKSMKIEESMNVRVDELDRDLRYYIDNQEANAGMFDVPFDELHMNEFSESYQDLHLDFTYTKNATATKGKSLYNIFNYEKNSNRFLILMTSLLCGHLDQDKLDNMLGLLGKIRPEIEELDEDDLVDYWMISTCQFVKAASKISEDNDMIFRYAKHFLKITRILMIQLSRELNNPYFYSVLEYFSEHTKLTYGKGRG